MIESRPDTITFSSPCRTTSQEAKATIKPSLDLAKNHIQISLLLENPVYQSIGTTRKYDSNKSEFAFDSPNHHIYYLKKGGIDFVQQSLDTERLMRIGPFDQPGFMFDMSTTYSFRATPTLQSMGRQMHPKETVLWEITMDEIETLIKDQDQLGTFLACNLLASTVLRCNLFETKAFEKAYFKVANRVAAYLLQNETDDTLKTSHENIANYNGTFRETVSTELREFKEMGAVEIYYGRIKITDREILEDFAFGLFDPTTYGNY